MSTRTIEPIQVVLPDAEGGYYRFGKLPQLISEALRPDTEEADADPQGSYYMFRALDQMDYEKDLQQAATLPPGDPGYLHVVENSASKRPLEWRMGAVLDGGLVHLDWLNEWGESRKPPLVFRALGASEPQASPPPPIEARTEPQTTPEVRETTQDRRNRWLDMFEAEEKLGKRGALQRVADREGVDRSNMKKDINKARVARDTERRAGGWSQQLVKDGKRKL